MEYNVYKSKSINISYLEQLDGGGMALAQDFVTLVKKRFGKVGRLFEWCSGPGFIGYSLLGHGLCETLCLADINPAAVEACKVTMRQNNLMNKVDIYLSDCLDDVPKTEQWDLVVGNPPHFNTSNHYPHFGPKTLYLDDGWELHRKFYNQVSTYLNLQGNILLIEHSSFSTPETFRNMLEEGGLTFVNTYPTQLPSRLYYIHSTRQQS